MKSLLSILRAAHCRSTHHRFAVDALPMVQTEPGERLARLLLRYPHRYLTGASDPDVRFRDFQNHVIHVADGYWGGAPRVAYQWYDALQRALRRKRFSEAAHAAGVLSHYFTDPIQPLHTHQCETAELIHRPIEWSIFCSYETILGHWRDDEFRVVFQLGDGPGWLGEAMLHASRLAHRQYRGLIDGYRLDAAVAEPAAALAGSSLPMLSELFGLAITGWARILERAAADAEAATGARLPEVSLSGPTIAAAVRAPLGAVRRWLAVRQQREAVAELIDEIDRTGTLQEHLPAEVDVVRRVIQVHRDEQRWKQRRQEPKAASPASLRLEPSDGAVKPPAVSQTQRPRAA